MKKHDLELAKTSVYDLTKCHVYDTWKHQIAAVDERICTLVIGSGCFRSFPSRRGFRMERATL